MTARKVSQPDLIDLLLADYQKPEDLIGENGILKQLTKGAVAWRAYRPILMRYISRFCIRRDAAGFRSAEPD